MAEQNFRVGIIGCGGIANGKHMKSIRGTGQAEMVAFCDIIQERAEKAAKDYGIEGANVYTDYRELLEDPTIDIVDVCTPNRSHSFISVDALEAGKHVICEKPMAINFEEAQKMLEAARRTGKKLTIGYQNRWRSECQFVKEAAANGDFGEMYFGQALALRRRGVPTWGVFIDEYEQGGGPLIDIGTHALDLTLWVMQNYKPKTVLGTSYHKLGHQTRTGNGFGDWDPKTYTAEDSAFGMIVMENGATILLESSWALNIDYSKEACFRVAGVLGGASIIDGLKLNHIKYGRQCIENVDCGGPSGVAFFDGKSSGDPGVLEQLAFYQAIRDNTEVPVKPEEAIVVTQILEAIYQSASTGTAVSFS